jgi:hypothetical protein
MRQEASPADRSTPPDAIECGTGATRSHDLAPDEDAPAFLAHGPSRLPLPEDDDFQPLHLLQDVGAIAGKRDMMIGGPDDSHSPSVPMMDRSSNFEFNRYLLARVSGAIR